MKYKNTVWLLLLLVTSATSVQADPWFVNPYRVVPDAYKLQHAVAKFEAKLIAYNADSALRTEASLLRRSTADLTATARRQSSRYTIFGELDKVTKGYQRIQGSLDVSPLLDKHHSLQLAWEDLQQSYDNFYYDLHGYDLYDPYFAHHPDFAAPIAGRYYSAPAISLPITARETQIQVPYRVVPTKPVQAVTPTSAVPNSPALPSGLPEQMSPTARQF
ncbi:MAG: hypothetical protein COA78_04890 [Blastopirellula sp.]|nr:MAG: hypothetical protein COA78_04890 [Blastopirellula sp.]